VRQAYLEFLRSCPLAVRLANGVFICHSLPDSSDCRTFDPRVFERAVQPQDLAEGGDVFRLVWGRNFCGENADAFARAVKAKMLIHGHEPCTKGFAVPNSKQIILDSSQSAGCCLLLSVSEPVSQQGFVRRICHLGQRPPQKKAAPVPGP
jgi:hypothetical protein